MKTVIVFISNSFSATTSLNEEKVERQVDLSTELEAFDTKEFVASFVFGSVPYMFLMSREEIEDIHGKILANPDHYMNKSCGVFKQIVPKWCKTWIKFVESRVPGFDASDVLSKEGLKNFVAANSTVVSRFNVNPETLELGEGEPAAAPAAAAPATHVEGDPNDDLSRAA